MDNTYYSNIDMIKTGKALKYRIYAAGYSVKDIQKLLYLSCPQPVYRWFRGQILPSVHHLYVLSRLLGVHMEDLLIPENILEDERFSDMKKRVFFYWQRLGKIME